jgi:hypothetical protein
VRYGFELKFLSQSAHCANIKCAVCFMSIVYPTQVQSGGSRVVDDLFVACICIIIAVFC